MRSRVSWLVSLFCGPSFWTLGCPKACVRREQFYTPTSPIWCWSLSHVFYILVSLSSLTYLYFYCRPRLWHCARAALEVVRCLEGVVTALHKIENFHRRCNLIPKTTGGSGDESNGNVNRLVAWKAFLREVRAAAAYANASGGGGGEGATAAPSGGGRDRPGRRPPAGMKEKEMAKAGLVLLRELEPLERVPEVRQWGQDESGARQRGGG